MEANLKPQKQMMFLSRVTPEECLERAQVAILNENGWAFIAPAPYRAYVLSAPLPNVNCPVVDVRQVRVEDDDRMFAVINECVNETVGVIDMDGLLNGLEELGAQVTRVQTRGERVANRGRGDQMRVN